MPQGFDSEIINIYNQLYPQQHLLNGAPVLSIDPQSINETTIDSLYVQIDSQLSAMVSYLLGANGVNLSVSQMLDIVTRHYKNDDFWRRILLSYIAVRQRQDKQMVLARKQEVKQEGKALLDKVSSYRKYRNQIISTFARKIKEQRFPIDGEKLIRNYLNMAERKPEEAWKLLTTNPSVFAPLEVVTSEGTRLLSVKEAEAMNKKIGQFAAKMKS